MLLYFCYVYLLRIICFIRGHVWIDPSPILIMDTSICMRCGLDKKRDL